MILPFKTQYTDGTPTQFIDKIWAGLDTENIVRPMKLAIFRDRLPEHQRKLLPSNLWENAKLYAPKLHTIREDAKDRWHVGRKIHMVVFNRTKNQFQFAPVLECTAVQKIRIWEAIAYKFYIQVDDKILREGEDRKELNRLANNDGFGSIEDMIEYFKSTNSQPLDFLGKIIHWTDLRY